MTRADVDTSAELFAAVGDAAVREINIAPGTYDLGGKMLSFEHNNVEVHGHGEVHITKGGVLTKANSLFFENLICHAGYHDPDQDDAMQVVFRVYKEGIRSENVEIRNCEFYTGADETFSIWGGKNVRVYNCIVAKGAINAGHSKGNRGKGMLIGVSEDIHIEGCYMHTNLDRNPLINGCYGLTLKNNATWNYGHAGLGIYPEYMPITDALISGNHYRRGPLTVDHVQYGMLIDHDAKHADRSKNIVFENNATTLKNRNRTDPSKTNVVQHTWKDGTPPISFEDIVANAGVNKGEVTNPISPTPIPPVVNPIEPIDITIGNKKVRVTVDIALI